MLRSLPLSIFWTYLLWWFGSYYIYEYTKVGTEPLLRSPFWSGSLLFVAYNCDLKSRKRPPFFEEIFDNRADISSFLHNVAAEEIICVVFQEFGSRRNIPACEAFVCAVRLLRRDQSEKLKIAINALSILRQTKAASFFKLGTLHAKARDNCCNLFEINVVAMTDHFCG